MIAYFIAIFYEIKMEKMGFTKNGNGKKQNL